MPPSSTNEASVLFNCALPAFQVLSATSGAGVSNGWREGGVDMITMIVPDSDPWELFVAFEKIEVGTVVGIPLTILIPVQLGKQSGEEEI